MIIPKVRRLARQTMMSGWIKCPRAELLEGGINGGAGRSTQVRFAYGQYWVSWNRAGFASRLAFAGDLESGVLRP